MALILLCGAATAWAADEPTPRQLLDRSKRIVFLGDSITASGQYVAYFDAWRELQQPRRPVTVIDCALSSETVSGLSEEGHAAGHFPRPDLADRLLRTLGVTKPDLVIACYGINCAIYQPFDEQRFQRYQQGMEALKAAVEHAHATFVAITPPTYDDQRKPLRFSYNEVLDRYSQWLVGQRKAGWLVIDLHEPMTHEIERRRASDPKFTFQPDGVHPNDAGQWYIAQKLIGWFGDESVAKIASPQQMLADAGAPAELLPLVIDRLEVLRDAYVFASGHKRPGVVPGLPIPEANKRAEEITQQIDDLLSAQKR